MKKLALSMVISCCLALEGNAQVLWDLETKAVIPPYENPTLTSTPARFEGGISVNGGDFTANSQEIMVNLPKLQEFFPSGKYGAVIYELSPADTVDIRFRLYPDQAHIGKMANIVVAGSYVDIHKFLDFVKSNWWKILFDFFTYDANGKLSIVGSLTDFDFLQEGLQPYFFMLSPDSVPLWFQKDDPGTKLLPYQAVSLQETHDFSLYKGPLGAGIIAISCFYYLEDESLVVFNQTPIGALIMDGTMWDTILEALFW